MTLTKNIGKTDRNIRMALAGVLILAGIAASVAGMGTALVIVLTVAGLVLLGTGFVGVCPAYIPLGIDTTKGDQSS